MRGNINYTFQIYFKRCPFPRFNSFKYAFSSGQCFQFCRHLNFFFFSVVAAIAVIRILIACKEKKESNAFDFKHESNYFRTAWTGCGYVKLYLSFDFLIFFFLSPFHMSSIYTMQSKCTIDSVQYCSSRKLKSTARQNIE